MESSGTLHKGLVGLIAGLILAIGLALTPAAGAEAAEKEPLPIIFVHGNSGSAQQFESNAMRFVSNDFPQDRLFTLEYDTTVDPLENEHAHVALDALIEKVKAKTGASKVNVMAHSRGTIVMFQYLGSSADRAAQVNKYVNIDGVYREYLPGGVPTLALWAEGDSSREITGAINVTYPELSHTEIATSPEGFKQAYRFFLGKDPETTNIVPENPNKVTVAGRALNFPANTGMTGSEISVYELNADTGQRLKQEAVYTKTIDETGNFGPFKVDGYARYEFVVVRDGFLAVHNYPEPFERDNHFFRVLSASALTPYLDQSPNHSNVAVTRMREWRSDQTGDGANDQLLMNGENVLAPPIAPRAKRILAVFNLDRDVDGVSDHSEIIFPFSAIPSFLTGTDTYLPASADGSGTIRVVEKMRAPRAQTKVTNIANWPADKHSLSVYFKDYTAQKYKFRKAKIGKVKVRGPGKLKKGKKGTYKVKIWNSGETAATGVKVKVSGRGITAKKPVGTIPASKTKTVRVKVKPKNPGRIKVSFKVTSKKAGSKTVKKKINVKK